MSRPLWVVSVIGGTLAIAMACSKESPSPSAPSTAGPVLRETIDAVLKASAPTPQSPVNGQKLVQDAPIVLVVSNSTTPYASGVALTYKFELYNAAGAKVYTSPNVNGGSGTTSHVVTLTLEGDQPYTWQARAEYQGGVGPYSSRGSFVTPQTDGYIRGNELYDPLFNGKTVGEGHDVAFVPGVGIRLLNQTSFVRYALQQTLANGEISMLVTNITSGTPGVKTKVFSMSEGDDDLTTNRRRFTVEKRGGSDAGAVAFRVITSEDQIETIGAERRALRFVFTTLYYWRATFGGDGRNGVFNLTIDEGGVGGDNIYNYGKEYSGTYDPNPHLVFLGSPPNRSGPDSQTVPNMVIRQVWVSSRPRPAYANK